MNMEDPKANGPLANPEWSGRRKRIVAREIAHHPSGGAGSATGNAVSRIDVRSGDLSDAPRPSDSATTESVLDPTQLGERHRKAGHQAAYRLAQGATLLAFLAAATAIALAIAENARVSKWLAGGACVLALASLPLVRSSRLVFRLRGYVAAACILSAIALALSLMPGLFHDDGKPVPHAAPKPPPTGAELP
jgi:hypothetical protein